MSHYLFTSEAVLNGHPDKIADQIADAILDACLEEDKNSRVSLEVLLSAGLVVLAGEITTKAFPDYQSITRKVVQDIGYNDGSLGFDYRSLGIITTINKQSIDIARGLHQENESDEFGAGDQGIMFGYATDETEELMPITIMTAQKIAKEIVRLRQSNELLFLRPDGKVQVTFEFDKEGLPLRLHTVVISVQHTEDVLERDLIHSMKEVVKKIVPKKYLDDKTLYYINPTGRFVIGGPIADTGMTGRKIMVDTYGGVGRHGGGSFSGKDPSKVDRSGAYAARHVAKNIVKAKLAKRCEVQISYAIGRSEPISIKIETFNTSKFHENDLIQAVKETFCLTPKGIIETLNLRRPIYSKTAFGGHFGRNEAEFTWEKCDSASVLSRCF